MEDESILETLKKDPAKGSDLLMERLKADPANRNYYLKLLALKSLFNSASDIAGNNDVAERMLQLARQAFDSKPKAQEPSIIAEEIARQKKEYFLLKGTPNKLVLEGKGLCKTYRSGNFKLEDVNVSLRFGEITGLVGENGNGKTTLLKIIAGELLQDSGQVTLNLDNDDDSSNDWMHAKSQMAYLPQELQKIPGVMIDTLRFTAAVHGLRGKYNDAEVNYIVERFNLRDHKHKTWDKLSGGYKLRFSLARILLRKPLILLMDEPLASLDIHSQNNLLNDLKELCKSLNNPITILFSSQHIEEVEAVSDKILLLSKGKQVYYGLTEDVGKLRSENTFEIKTRLLKEELIQQLTGLKYTSLYYTGLSYLINTGLDIPMDVIMQYCASNAIPVQSIRDISNSTRQFLLKIGEN